MLRLPNYSSLLRNSSTVHSVKNVFNQPSRNSDFNSNYTNTAYSWSFIGRNAKVRTFCNLNANHNQSKETLLRSVATSKWMKALIAFLLFGTTVDIVSAVLNYKEFSLDADTLRKRIWNECQQPASELLQHQAVKKHFGKDIHLIGQKMNFETNSSLAIPFVYRQIPYRLNAVAYKCEAALSLPIEGSHGKGNIVIEAFLELGEWKFKSISAQKDGEESPVFKRTFYYTWYTPSWTDEVKQ